MKLLIATDMEGISGVANWDHVTPGSAEWQRFRHVMTADVNAAVDGAARAGATEIVVSDGHWNSTNILIEELDPRARLNAGSPAPFSMVQGVDGGVDAALFIGYHARHGTPQAILDHTWSNVRISNLWLNGRLAGEFALNGGVCGAFGAPVLMVSGDQSVCAEAREWVPGVETAQVKTAVGRQSAEFLPLQEAQRKIREAAYEAVGRFVNGKGPAPLIIPGPVTVTIEYATTLMTDQASLLPGCKRLDGRRIEFTAPDMPTAYQNFRAAVNLASA